MTHKRFFLRVLTLFGVVLSVLIFTMAMLTLVRAEGADALITIVKEPDQTVVSGSTAAFTITIINTGDVTLTNVTVADAQVSDCNRTFGSLLVEESASYTCAAADVVNSFTNSATVTGTQPAGPDVTDADTAVVTVINPDVQIAKTPDTQIVVSGSAVTFTIAVTNTGDATLTNVMVTDGEAPNCDAGPVTLGVDQSWSYSCTADNVLADFTNTALVAGTPPAGPDVSDSDTAFVDVVNPGIEIAKTPDSQTVLYDSTVTFTIAVANTGDVPLANVIVTDTLAPDCAQAVGVLAVGGDHTYTCTVANVVADFTNTAIVTGTPPVGADVNNSDTAFVDVIGPDIEIAKTPDMQTVASGSSVSFNIAVTNTGDVPLTNVTVSDAQAPNCVRVGGQLPNLAPGGSTSYGCTLANVTDGFINSAVASGTPPVVGDVTDADAAMVKLDDTQDCPDHMIAYWKLDETSGTTYDDFYDGHDGQCAGSCPIPVTGHVNGGQAFNGSNTGIDVPAVPGDDSFNWDVDDSFSIEFWMKADSAGSCSHGNEVIVGRDDGSDSQLHWWVGIGCWAGGRAAFVLRDNEGDIGVVVGTTDLTDGSWYHIVAVRDASTNRIRIYVNGTEEAAESVSYSAGFGSPTAALNIGWLDLESLGFRFDGVVDEIALYDRALPTDEIRQHRNEGLVGRWYCEEVGTFAPLIVSAPVTEATVGRPYVYDVEAAGNPSPAYTLVVSPSGMTIDPGTGLISWMPTIAQEGNHGVEVEASNSEGTDTQSFAIAVHEGTICPADMIAYWKLGETSGTTYDDFFDGHDGMCAGQCPTPATGYVNGGQEFNGSDTGVGVPADEEAPVLETKSLSAGTTVRPACTGGLDVRMVVKLPST